MLVGRIFGAVLSGTAVFWGAAAEAAEPCTPVVGRLASVEGEVELQRAGEGGWGRATVGQALCQRDTIRTGRYSRAAAALVNDAVLRLDESTTLYLADVTPEVSQRSLLNLIAGAIQSFSRRPRQLGVNTPYVNATVEGTEFALRVQNQETQLTVFEGRVAAANELGQARAGPGGSVVAQAGKPPEQRVIVRPRDAVQWAMYYPPILAPRGAAEAASLAEAGDIAGALRALDRVPETQRDASFYVTRGGLVLRTGRVDAAQDAINRALSLEPGLGAAYALRAVIEVVQNQKAQALADGRRAVELSPGAAAPWIALSYAQQANFDLEAARGSLQTATQVQPEDALAWARLSELWLALGYRDRARAVAQRAASLAPGLERTQTVSGFASLSEFRTEEARAAFERAIALDSAAPLPRLGLGLALIREGNTQEGRRNLEIAAGLDGNDALMRAYLGKAYFHEFRGPLAAQQFEIAKELDPRDPTAYFYDAILKQADNRPVEAFHEVEEAIERNDNRAVYRSRLALDQDLAARSVSLGRIYDYLGFHDLGTSEATESLTLDPANASAHRFLSDLYLGVRRREIARVSELLQSQMLQDININPVQPSLSEANLNIQSFGGPTNPGFNEFTPLFQGNQIRADVTGLAGNDNTYGGEGVVSGIHNGLSLSAGAFHYAGDGFRPNFSLKHDIYNVFGQAALTPELNVQFELRRRQTRHGDLEQKFDPDVFNPDSQRKLHQDIARVGARWTPMPGSSFLLSAAYSYRDERLDEQEPFFGSVLATDLRNRDKAHQTEGQYIFERPELNLVVGGGFSHVKRNVSQALALDGIPVFSAQSNPSIQHPRGYTYGNFVFPKPVTWTLGVSYDHYKESGLRVGQVNPKLGARVQITNDLVLRAGVVRVLKPALVNNRTLEPTEVAGFNQLFDDINATKSWRYGIGLDWRAAKDVYAGAEATGRQIRVPVFGPDGPFFEHQNEQLHRAYLYWTPRTDLAIGGEVVYDRFRADEGTLTQGTTVPTNLQTISVPLGIRYFHDSGFFAGLRGTLAHQNVDRSPLSTFPTGSSNFFLVDIGAGYRVPERAAIASVEVRNLFDTKFKYQDDSFREFRDEPSTGPYIPGIQIITRITFSF